MMPMETGCIHEKSSEMYVLLMTEFDCPQMTPCGQQDPKIQLLTHFLLPVRRYFSVILLVFSMVLFETFGCETCRFLCV